MKLISPSIMCIDIFKLENSIKELEREKIDYLHMDVMDGNFVPNITLGIDFIKKIREESTIPLDIHLMIKEVDEKISWFDFQEGEIVSIHVETVKNLDKLIEDLKRIGCKVLLAIKPKTRVENYFKYLDKIDGFLLMMVEPGFAGQTLIEKMMEKIYMCRTYIDKNNFSNKILQVDGNVSYLNAERMSKLGANMFVAGSSSFLAKDADISNGIKEFRKRIG